MVRFSFLDIPQDTQIQAPGLESEGGRWVVKEGWLCCGGVKSVIETTGHVGVEVAD